MIITIRVLKSSTKLLNLIDFISIHPALPILVVMAIRPHPPGLYLFRRIRVSALDDKWGNANVYSIINSSQKFDGQVRKPSRNPPIFYHCSGGISALNID